jgi:hypothetical protein
VPKVWLQYAFSLFTELRELEAALEDGRFRSYDHGPQVLVVTSGRQRKVICRFEGGRDVITVKPA